MMKYLSPIFENIPDEIKSLPQFVNWKEETREGKLTKTPRKPHGGYAKTNNPSTWSTFEACRKASDKFDGIGLVLTSDDPYVALDFDKCYCPAFNLIDPIVEQHIKNLNGYTEYSPSGRGIRALVKGILPVAGRKNGSCEVYSSGRYVTLTGHALPAYPRTIENRQTEIDQFYEEVFPDKNTEKNKPEKSYSQSINPWDGLKKALESKNGEEIQRLLDGDFSNYPSQSEADLALCSHLAFWLNGDKTMIDNVFRDSKLYRGKWDEKRGCETYGQLTINRAVEGCDNFYSEHSQIEDVAIINPVHEKKTDTLPFPEIMSGLAGECADLYSSYLEPPKHFFYICFLACLGSFLPIRLASELNTQPRLFVVLLGQSADDKKSTAMEKTIDFFQEDLPTFNVCFGVGSAEGLQKQLKESPRLLLCLDELKQLIGKCKIDGSVLLPCINTLFESNNYESQTKTSSIKLNDVHLSILAASTLQTYEHTWDSSFTDIGFNNRLFIVPGSGIKKYSFPKKIPSQDKSLLQDKLAAIASFVGNGLEIDISDGARLLYDDWYKKQDRSIHAKRLDTYALRFMMLLAVNEMKKTIDESIVEKAIKIMDWQLAARQLHDPIDADNQTAKMEEKIRRVLRTGSRSDRDLRRAVHSERAGLGIYNYAIKNLTTAHEIQFDKSTNCWGLSPLLSPSASKKKTQCM